MEDIDLAVEKTVAFIEPLTVGDQIVFTITLTNLSMDQARNIEISDLLDSGFSYSSHTASIGEYDPLTGLWTLDELAGNQVAGLVINVEVVEAGTLENTASLVSSFPNDGDITNNTSTVNYAGKAFCSRGMSGSIKSSSHPMGTGLMIFWWSIALKIIPA